MQVNKFGNTDDPHTMYILVGYRAGYFVPMGTFHSCKDTQCVFGCSHTVGWAGATKFRNARKIDENDPKILETPRRGKGED